MNVETYIVDLGEFKQIGLTSVRFVGPFRTLDLAAAFVKTTECWAIPPSTKVRIFSMFNLEA